MSDDIRSMITARQSRWANMNVSGTSIAKDRQQVESARMRGAMSAPFTVKPELREAYEAARRDSEANDSNQDKPTNVIAPGFTDTGEILWTDPKRMSAKVTHRGPETSEEFEDRAEHAANEQEEVGALIEMAQEKGDDRLAGEDPEEYYDKADSIRNMLNSKWAKYLGRE